MRAFFKPVMIFSLGVGLVTALLLRQGTEGHASSSTGNACQELARGPVARREIALTFDAGGEAAGLKELLDLLSRERIPATFFVTGRWTQEHPVAAQMLARSGHRIGNHSWAHPEYTRLTDEALLKDLAQAEELLRQVYAQPVRPLFRAPFGDRDDRVLQLLCQKGYRSIYWTVDTLDSMEPRKTAEFIAGRVLSKTDAQLAGAIVLSHVGYPETVQALPAIVAGLRARGFRFVSVVDWLEPQVSAKPQPATLKGQPM